MASPPLSEHRHVPVESLDLEEVARSPLHAEDVTRRLEAAPASSLEHGGPEEPTVAREFRQPMGVLLQATRDTARRPDDDPRAPLTTDHAMALEAVARADGTRPPVPAHDGSVDPRPPLAGNWADLLETTRSTLSGAVQAVGRVDPEHPMAHDCFGTAWVVDSGARPALTNLYVVEAMWRRSPHHMEPTDRGMRVRAGLFVDFIGEFGGRRRDRFRVVEDLLRPTVDGPGLLRQDSAVLRLAPTSEGETDLPRSIRISTSLDGPEGSFSSFRLVGFPAPPRRSGGRHEGMDRTWVHTTPFGHEYGIKRLAPGVTQHPPGSLDDDDQRRVFGHDRTTLGGNSGSPIIAWLDPTPRGFGLHFADATRDSNFAHALGACTPELEALGVPTGRGDGPMSQQADGPSPQTGSSGISPEGAGRSCGQPARTIDLFGAGHRPEKFTRTGPRMLWAARHDRIPHRAEDPTDEERQRWVQAQVRRGVDRAAWPRRASAGPEDAIPITADPLLATGERRTTGNSGSDGAVNEIVADPCHRHTATIAGDSPAAHSIRHARRIALGRGALVVPRMEAPPVVAEHLRAVLRPGRAEHRA